MLSITPIDSRATTRKKYAVTRRIEKFANGLDGFGEEQITPVNWVSIIILSAVIWFVLKS